MFETIVWWGSMGWLFWVVVGGIVFGILELLGKVRDEWSDN